MGDGDDSDASTLLNYCYGAMMEEPVGINLTLALYWGDIGGPLHNAQGLSMYSTQDFLLIGGDDFQNCIYRVTKTHKEDTPVLEIVYKYNPFV